MHIQYTSIRLQTNSLEHNTIMDTNFGEYRTSLYVRIDVQLSNFVLLLSILPTHRDLTSIHNGRYLFIIFF